MALENIVIGIADRMKKKDIDAYLFDGPFVRSKGISLKEGDLQLFNYMKEHPRNSYFIFGLGGHDAWKKIQNPVRTIYNGMVTSFVGIFSPSPDLNITLLRSIGMHIKEPSSYLPKEQKRDLRVSIAPYCAFDCFFPELISIGYGTQLGLQSVVVSHVNQGEYWVIGNVDIGNNVIVGAKSMIGPGVKIGDYAKINAGSLVNFDVPAGAVVGGSPAKVLGKRKIREVVLQEEIPKITKKNVMDEIK